LLMLATSFEVAIIPTLSAVRKGGVYRTLTTIGQAPKHLVAVSYPERKHQ